MEPKDFLGSEEKRNPGEQIQGGLFKFHISRRAKFTIILHILHLFLIIKPIIECKIKSHQLKYIIYDKININISNHRGNKYLTAF